MREQKLHTFLTDLQIAVRDFKTNPSSRTESTLKCLWNELCLLYLHKYDYNLAKLKWNFNMQGDRPGKMLAKRVKQNQTRTRIPFMMSKDNQVIMSPRLLQISDYYQELYNLEKSSAIPPILPGKIYSFLSKIPLAKLTQQQLDSLNQPPYKKFIMLLNPLNYWNLHGPMDCQTNTTKHFLIFYLPISKSYEMW